MVFWIFFILIIFNMEKYSQVYYFQYEQYIRVQIFLYIRYTIPIYMALIKPITLEIDEDLWTKFKEKVPRTIRLNDALISLIEKEVGDNEEKKQV